MKKIALSVIAAATLFGTAAASAQSFEVSPGGVRIDDGYRDGRGWDRDRNRDFRRSRDEVIVIKRGHDRDRDGRRRDWDGPRNRGYDDRY